MDRRASDRWYQTVWLPFAAATYIVICIFDFIIMPVYVTAHNSRIENAVFKTLEAKDAAEFADGLVRANQAARQWNPLTLLGAGMFHLSFGALLTGGAVTRGMAKRSEVEGFYRYNQNYGNYSDERDNYDYNTGIDSPMPRRRNQRYQAGASQDGPMPKAPMTDD